MILRASAWKLVRMRWRSTGARERPDVAAVDDRAALEDGARLGGQHEVLGGARAGAVRDELAHLARRAPAPRAG